MNINKNFIIVFTPKDKNLYGKRRFAVGAKSLHKYIGQENANKLLVEAIECPDQVYTRKLRTKGTVQFYSK